MKTKDFKNIYRNLRPEEQAKMTFKSLTNDDTKSAMQIRDSVKRYDYNGIDINYRTTLNGIYDVCSLLAIEFWKTHSLYMSSLFVRANYRVNDTRSDDAIKSDMENTFHFARKLMAIGCVLKSVCESQSIDIDTVLKATGAKDFGGVDIGSCELDDSFTEYYLNTLALCESLITGAALTKQQENNLRLI